MDTLKTKELPVEKNELSIKKKTRDLEWKSWHKLLKSAKSKHLDVY